MGLWRDLRRWRVDSEKRPVPEQGLPASLAVLPSKASVANRQRQRDGLLFGGGRFHLQLNVPAFVGLPVMAPVVAFNVKLAGHTSSLLESEPEEKRYGYSVFVQRLWTGHHH